MPPLRVRRLHLTGPRERLGRARTVIEDALHTASLPLGRPGALLVVRRLDLGVVDPDRPSQSLSPRIERLVRELVREAAPAGTSAAAEAPAVWFRDEAVARVALIARVLRGPPPDEWYWAAAVPAWRAAPGSARIEALLELPAQAPAFDVAPLSRRVAVLIVELTRAGLLVEVLERVDVPARWCAPLLAVAPAPFRGGAIGVATAGEIPIQVESGPPALVAVTARWGATSPAARIVRAAFRLVEAPELPARRAVPPAERGVAARRVAPQAPLRESRAETVENRTLPYPTPPPRPIAPLPPAPALPLPAAGTSVEAPAPSAERPPPRTTTASPPENRPATEPRPAPAAAPPWLPGRRIDPARGRLALPFLDGVGVPTGWGGLFFALPLLAALGLPEGLVGDVDPTFGWWVLGAVLERVGADPEDGAVLLVSRLVSEDRPDAGVLDAWVDALAALWADRAEQTLEALVGARGVMVATPTHIDVLLDGSELRIEVRRRALDADPGWVWWLGKVIAFHYVEHEDFEGVFHVEHEGRSQG